MNIQSYVDLMDLTLDGNRQPPSAEGSNQRAGRSHAVQFSYAPPYEDIIETVALVHFLA